MLGHLQPGGAVGVGVDVVVPEGGDAADRESEEQDKHAGRADLGGQGVVVEAAAQLCPAVVFGCIPVGPPFMDYQVRKRCLGGRRGAVTGQVEVGTLPPL